MLTVQQFAVAVTEKKCLCNVDVFIYSHSLFLVGSYTLWPLRGWVCILCMASGFWFFDEQEMIP